LHVYFGKSEYDIRKHIRIENVAFIVNGDYGYTNLVENPCVRFIIVSIICSTVFVHSFFPDHLHTSVVPINSGVGLLVHQNLALSNHSVVMCFELTSASQIDIGRIHTLREKQVVIHVS